MQKIINLLKRNRFEPFVYRFSSRAPNTPTYYELLELKPNCAQKDIKENFARLAKLYHPDVYKGSDRSRFQKINEAYQVLKNVTKRREYDSNVLGIRPGSEFTAEAPEQDSSADQEQNPKNSDDMYSFEESTDKTKQEINLNEEFQQFINRPTKHTPDRVIVVEDPFLRQLNLEERIRYEVKNFANDPDLHLLKYGHHKG